MRTSALSSFALLAVAVTGCTKSVAITVVDIDAASKPLGGAQVAYYPLPHRNGDAWATSPTETQTTDASGKTTFAHNSGRFVVTAPGKGSASVSTTFAPQKLEIGVGSAK